MIQNVGVNDTAGLYKIQNGVSGKSSGLSEKKKLNKTEKVVLAGLSALGAIAVGLVAVKKHKAKMFKKAEQEAEELYRQMTQREKAINEAEKINKSTEFSPEKIDKLVQNGKIKPDAWSPKDMKHYYENLENVDMLIKEGKIPEEARNWKVQGDKLVKKLENGGEEYYLRTPDRKNIIAHVKKIDNNQYFVGENIKGKIVLREVEIPSFGKCTDVKFNDGGFRLPVLEFTKGKDKYRIVLHDNRTSIIKNGTNLGDKLSVLIAENNPNNMQQISDLGSEMRNIEVDFNQMLNFIGRL